MVGADLPLQNPNLWGWAIPLRPGGGSNPRFHIVFVVVFIAVAVVVVVGVTVIEIETVGGWETSKSNFISCKKNTHLVNEM